MIIVLAIKTIANFFNITVNFQPPVTKISVVDKMAIAVLDHGAGRTLTIYIQELADGE